MKHLQKQAGDFTDLSHKWRRLFSELPRHVPARQYTRRATITLAKTLLDHVEP